MSYSLGCSVIQQCGMSSLVPILPCLLSVNCFHRSIVPMNVAGSFPGLFLYHSQEAANPYSFHSMFLLLTAPALYFHFPLSCMNYSRGILQETSAIVCQSSFPLSPILSPLLSQHFWRLHGILKLVQNHIPYLYNALRSDSTRTFYLSHHTMGFTRAKVLFDSFVGLFGGRFPQ